MALCPPVLKVMSRCKNKLKRTEKLNKRVARHKNEEKSECEENKHWKKTVHPFAFLKRMSLCLISCGMLSGILKITVKK